MQELTRSERSGLGALRSGVERYQTKQRLIADLLTACDAVLSGAAAAQELAAPVAALRQLPSLALEPAREAA